MTCSNKNSAHLNYIAKRLGEGRAVVMVGAGFSKNASSKYPLWSDLGDKLYELANGHKPKDNKNSYQSLLKVAEEAEAMVGRPALDSFLMDSIPDKEVEPSQLHIDLLSLGWRDVFTTNYDTLLERASEKVDKFKYSPVLNQNDLCSARQPRIVKLHGSFRHSRPFIFTEEDYRKYPTDNAPFVNTVLQSLLENTLVLIGFSGDDPNFLQWIGWIRDKLGSDHTQPIYLVTASDFSPAQRALIASRKINIVNMAYEVRTKQNIYLESLKKFIDMLAKAELDKRSWPKNEKQLQPNHGKFTASKLYEVQKVWQSQRSSYPGWVILPHDNRQLLYYKTRRYLDYEIDKKLLDQMTEGRDLEFLYELNWRLELCLTPLNRNLANAIKLALSREHKESIQEKLQEKWYKLALSLLRYNREIGDKKEFELLLSQLEGKEAFLNTEECDYLQYQKYLFLLSQLDLEDAKSTLKEWSLKDSQPFWKHIRMSCMLELGAASEPASSELETYLSETRLIGRDEDLFYFESTEAYQMLLVRAVSSSYTELKEERVSQDEVKGVFNKEFNKRNSASDSNDSSSTVLVNNKTATSQESDWEDLQSNKTTSRKEEWDRYEYTVKFIKSEQKGRLITSRLDQLRSGRIMPREEIRLLELEINNNTLEDSSTALEFARLQEVTGVPFKFDCVLMFNAETINKALSQLSFTHPYMAEAIMMRVGDTKSVNIVYSYERLLSMSIEEIDKKIVQYCECFKRIHSSECKRKFESIESRWLSLIPEVLSYLAHKCSNKGQDQIIKTIALFGRNAGPRYLHDYERLLPKLLSALPKRKLIEWLPELIDISEVHFYAWISSLNPIIKLDLSSIEIADPKAIKKLIHSLEDKVKTSNRDSKKREWAITCLFKLWSWGFMGARQKERLGKLLWSERDSDGFPSDTSAFYRFAFLDTLGNRHADVLKLFKDYILQKSFLLKENLDETDLENINSQLLTEMISASKLYSGLWTEEEGVTVFENIKTWWNTDKDRGDEQSSVRLFGEKDRKSKLLYINKLLADVVIPTLVTIEGAKYEQEIIGLIENMSSNNYEMIQAEAEIAVRVTGRRAVFLNSVGRALHSNSEESIREVHWAISRCLKLEDKEFRSELTQVLANFVEWHLSPKLEHSFWLVFRLLKDKPKHLDSSLLKSVLNRMKRLEKELDYHEGSADFALKDKVKLKETAVLLASKLNAHFKGKANYQEVINQWKAISNDVTEFAEVRNAWASS